MKKIFYLLGLLLLSSFSTKAQHLFAISLDSLKDGAIIYAKSGQLFHVKMYSNPSTGYRWDVEYDKKNIVLQEKKYFSNPVPEGWVGGGGQMYFTFMNKNTAKTTLSFIHIGPGARAKRATKTINMVSTKLETKLILGHWSQTYYEELVVREGEHYPHQQNYKKGDHSFTFKANKKGICKYKNTETGLFEEIDFKWDLKDNQLVISYIVGKDVQEPNPEYYRVTLESKKIILESFEREDDSNYIYSKMNLSK